MKKRLAIAAILTAAALAFASLMARSADAGGRERVVVREEWRLDLELPTDRTIDVDGLSHSLAGGGAGDALERP